jgi:hypothetical protein
MAHDPVRAQEAQAWLERARGRPARGRSRLGRRPATVRCEEADFYAAVTRRILSGSTGIRPSSSCRISSWLAADGEGLMYLKKSSSASSYVSTSPSWFIVSWSNDRLRGCETNGVVALQRKVLDQAAGSLDEPDRRLDPIHRVPQPLGLRAHLRGAAGSAGRRGAPRQAPPVPRRRGAASRRGGRRLPRAQPPRLSHARRR